jgi:hypothetical protein
MTLRLISMSQVRFLTDWQSRRISLSASAKGAAMRKFKVVLLFLLFESGKLIWSQTQPPKESATPHGDFYLGGAYTGSNPASNASAGVGGGADFRAYKWVGIQGDVSAFFATSGVANVTTTIDYLIGPRIAKPPSGSRLSAFADFLVGGQSFQNSSTQHSYFYTNGTGFAFASDGGLDIRLAKHLSLRGQAGVISSRYATPPTTTTNIRWRAGTFLVYSF